MSVSNRIDFLQYSISWARTHDKDALHTSLTCITQNSCSKLVNDVTSKITPMCHGECGDGDFLPTKLSSDKSIQRDSLAIGRGMLVMRHRGAYVRVGVGTF